MTSYELFNDLHQKKVDREHLETILQQAKKEHNTAVIYRISKILNDHPQVQNFEINIVQYTAPQGLAGTMHTGDYREALDDCGRLRKGWKFVKGSVVKSSPRPSPKERETAKPKISNVGKGYIPSVPCENIPCENIPSENNPSEEKNEKKTCKTCGKKYKFLIYKTQTSNKYTLAFSYADLADENKSVFDLRKKHKGKGYNEFFVINNAILLEKYKKDIDYLILSKEDFDKKEFYKWLDNKEVKKNVGKGYIPSVPSENNASEENNKTEAFLQKHKDIPLLEVILSKAQPLYEDSKTNRLGQTTDPEPNIIFWKKASKGKPETNEMIIKFKGITQHPLFSKENYKEYVLFRFNKKAEAIFDQWQKILQQATDYILNLDEKGEPKFYKDLAKNCKTCEKSAKNVGKGHVLSKEIRKKTREERKIKETENQPISKNDTPTKVTIFLNGTKKENVSAEDIKDIFDKKLSKSLRIESGFINTNEFDFKAPKTSKKGIESLGKIVAKGVLRPVLTGVLLEKDVYVGTDANKLLLLERDKNDGLKTGKIYDVNAKYSQYFLVMGNEALSEKEWNKNKRYVDAVFPKYQNIFPKQYKYKTSFVDIEPILNHAYKAYYLLKVNREKYDDYTIPFRIGNIEIYFNAHYLFDTLQCLYANGTKQVSFECVAHNKPLTIKSKENNNVALLMPVFGTKENELNINEVQIAATENQDFKENKGLAAPTAQSIETIAFNKEILKAKKEGFNTDKVLKLGKAKGELKKIIGDKEMRISQSTIKKAMTKDDSHIITWENLINLPDYLNNPLAIFKSKTAGFVVLTEIINAKNKPVIAPLHIVKKGNYIEVKSLYSRKNDSTYKNWVKEDLLLYINKKSDLAFKMMGTIPNLDSKSQSKNTKKSSNHKKNDKNIGLGLPLTDEIRQKAFTDKGKLRKGWYYEEGFLTDGKSFYISHNEPPIFYEEIIKEIEDKSNKKLKELKKIFNEKEADYKKRRKIAEKIKKKLGLSAPISVMQPAEPETKPSVFVEESPLTPERETFELVNEIPAVAHHRKGSLAQQLANASEQTESYQIDRYDMAQFLGDMEIKNVDSLVITLTGGQGSGKTRFAFQFMNDLAQRYKVGHISCEEHPQSRLYIEKAHQYLNATAMNNIEAHDVRSLSEIDKIIRENDVIVIDSFQKIKEIDSKFEVDKDLRKKYNGKLFLVIFQQTSDGKMRGGSKSQFDGDIILFTEKFANYQENYVYPDKNRYNSIPANELKYNIFQQRLLPAETETITNNENLIFDVIY